MSVTISNFGTTKTGDQISKFTISNSKGTKASVINYGAILTELVVKGKDIALGFDDLESYFDNGCFFGATVGPNANRIGNAVFSLDGKEYKLDVNDGPNNLHSHYDMGYHKRVYEAEVCDTYVTFRCKDSDGCMGFPGNKEVEVTYTLTEDDELKIHYHVTTDKKTIINMTNHSYFNLKGHNGGHIEDHVLTINASRYSEIVAGAIPTGNLPSVKGTVFDFTSPMAIGDHIEDDVEQLKLVKGYDHNWALDDTSASVKKIAELTCPSSDIKMEVLTDLPGVQFYAGNCISPCTGKGGAKYEPRCGMCLETQYFPNNVNVPDFTQAVFTPEKPFDSTTVYKFS